MLDKHRKTLRLTPSCLLLGLLLLSCPGRAESALTLLFAERPPYFSTQSDGSVAGLVATPVAEALRKAGIAATWETLPTNRALYEIQQNTRRACGIGWYLTPERAQFARFSDPISQDGPLVALAGHAFHPPDPLSFASVLRNQEARFLLKTGVIYTTAAAPLIDEAKIRARFTVQSWGDIVEEVAQQHYDLTFLIEEEAEYYLQQPRFKPGDLTILRFPELPGGELRRLMCSKLVDDDTLHAFNAALPKH